MKIKEILNFLKDHMYLTIFILFLLFLGYILDPEYFVEIATQKGFYIISVIATLSVAPFINTIRLYKKATPLYKPILKDEYNVKKVLSFMILPYIVFFLSFFLFKKLPALHSIVTLSSVFFLTLFLVNLYIDSILLTFNSEDYLIKKIQKHYMGETTSSEEDSKKFDIILKDHMDSERNSEKNIGEYYKENFIYIDQVKGLKKKKFRDFLEESTKNIVIRFGSYFKHNVFISFHFSGKLEENFKEKFKDCFKVGEISVIDKGIEDAYKNMQTYFVDLAKSNRSEDLIREIHLLKKISNESFFEKIANFSFYGTLSEIFKNKDGCFHTRVKESFFSLWISIFNSAKHVEKKIKSQLDRLFLALYTALEFNFWDQTFLNSKQIRKLIHVHATEESGLKESFNKTYISILIIYYIKGLKEKEKWEMSNYDYNIFIDLADDFIKYFKKRSRLSSKKILDHYYSKIFLLSFFLKDENLLEEDLINKQLLNKLNQNDLLDIITIAYNIPSNDSDLYDWTLLVERNRGLKIKNLIKEFLKERLKTNLHVAILNRLCCDKSIIELLSEIKKELEDEINGDNLVNLTSLIDRSKIMHELEDKIRDAFKEIPYEDLCVGITKDPQKKLQDHGNRLNNLGIKEEIRFFDTKAKDLFSAKQIKDYFLEKKCKKDELEKVEDEGEYIYVFAEPLKKKPSKFVNKLLTWAIIISAVYFTIKGLKRDLVKNKK